LAADPTKNIRLLHVDDEDNQLRLVRLYLERADVAFEITSVSSPFDALRRAEEEEYDCIILDYRLPYLTGIDLAQKIRERQKVPILLYTGHGSEEVAEKAFAVGIDDYLRKEFDPAHYQVLVRRIQAAIEKYRLEEEIQRSEERYRTLVEESGEAISVTVNGSIVYVNRRRLELTGHSDLSQLISHMGLENVHPDDVDKVKDWIASRSESEAVPIHQEFRLIRLDGSVIHVVDHVSNVEWQGEKAVMHILHDVTEERRMEEALRTSQERLKRFMDSAPDRFYLYDSDLRLLDLNSAATEYSGYSKEDQGIPFLEMFPLLSGIETYRRYLEVLETGEPVFIDAVLRRGREGEQEHWVSIRGFKVGEGLGIIVTDISQLKRYEGQLQVLHDHAQMLDNAQNIEEVCDATLEALKVTMGFEENAFLMVQGENLVLIGKSGSMIDSLILPMDSKGLTVKAANTKKTVLVNDIRDDPNYYDGAPGTLSELVVPVIIDGEVVAVINVESHKTDAFNSESRRLTETLAMHVSSAMSRIRQMTELEGTVEQKTRDLLNAERMVAAGRVASMVAHDLRSPLQTIRNALYLVKDDSSLSEEVLSIIDGSVRRATQMLDEFRAHTGEVQLNPGPTDVAEMIRAALNEGSIPSEVDVSLELGGGMGSVLLDRSKMRRVLDNLIRNAVEAMSGGGGLRVVARRESDLVIQISDTGPGIPEEIMEYLFKPFNTTKVNGMGLGLAYCRRILDAHGGSISVDTKDGEGSLFTLRIPPLDPGVVLASKG
jgi:PAS domain S-box-containing protein